MELGPCGLSIFKRDLGLQAAVGMPGMGHSHWHPVRHLILLGDQTIGVHSTETAMKFPCDRVSLRED
jgi:hypothetical protein